MIPFEIFRATIYVAAVPWYIYYALLHLKVIGTEENKNESMMAVDYGFVLYSLLS